MKRKVIQIANSTQLVSLPRKWCQSHGIKKGDELDVIEEQNSISVRVNTGNKEPERVVVDASGLGSATLSLVSALYKGGYDEFKVIFSSANELKYIQTIVKDSCLGFEIVEQGKNFVIARKISEPIPEEFDAVLRRTFVFLQNMIKETLAAVKQCDDNALNTVIAMDASINKFTYFLRRVLNKHGHGPYRITSPLYYIVDELEEIADRYKYICRARIGATKPPNKSLLHLFEQVNQMVELLNSMFYKFEWKKLNEVYAIKNQITASTNDLIMKMSKSEVPVLLNLLVVADKVYELDGPLVLSRYHVEVEHLPPTEEKQ